MVPCMFVVYLILQNTKLKQIMEQRTEKEPRGLLSRESTLKRIFRGMNIDILIARLFCMVILRLILEKSVMQPELFQANRRRLC